MRTFFNYLLTITLFIVVIVTITVFSIGNLTSKDSTRELLDNIDYEEVINNFKETNFGTDIYDYASNHGIEESRVDSLLQTNETKEYISEVIQKGIDGYLSNGGIEINSETKEFINTVNEKYNLNLNDNDKEELESYANAAINDNLNKVVNNASNDSDSSSSQFLIDIIKVCRDDNLHTILYITIGIITVLLFISSFKKKNFLEYIGIVSITVAISTLLFNGLLALIGDRISTSIVNANANILLLPVTNSFYMVTFIGIILGIVLFIIQHFINKHVKKEVVPF